MLENDEDERMSSAVENTISRNRQLKYVVVGMCFFLIFTLSYLYEMDKTYLANDSSVLISVLGYLGRLSYLPRSIISGTMFLLAAILGLEPLESSATINRRLLYLWIVFNAVFVIAGMFHNIQRGFLFSQIMVFLSVPLFYMGWIYCGHGKDLYTLFSAAVMVFTFIISLLCIIWFPYGEITVSQTIETGEIVRNVHSTVSADGVRYMGMMDNPSRVAHFATPGALCSLYLIFVWKGWKAMIPAISLGVSIAMALLCISRASIISILLAACGLLFLITRNDKESLRKMGVASIIAILALLVCFAAVNRGQDNYHLLSIRPPAAVAYAESDQDNTEESEGSDDSAIRQRFQLSGSINSLSSGRIIIWKAFLGKLNFAGHDVRYNYPVKVIDANSSPYYYYSYPHNVALDYAYRCGIPAGLLFLILELAGYVYCFKVLFSRTRVIKELDSFAVMGLLAFLITGNVESVDHVFTRIILVVFYLSLLPVFINRTRDHDI